MSTESFVGALALVGVVVLVSALLSGLVERSGLPQVAVFLGLGVVLGPAGLGLLDVTLDSPALRVVATLSLVLVLFTDATTVDVAEVRRYGRLALVVLGPGTLLPAALIALAGWSLLGLAPAAAAVLGAALASTDPVLLRGLLRRRDIPDAARHALHLESGLNDVVLLPIVLVAMAFLGHAPAGATGNAASAAGAATDGAGWARLAVELLLLGPGAGVLVGVVALAALDLVRRTIGMSRDFESLYALGIPLTAAAAAEVVHGSGFLAAFAAGLAIAAFDVDLCECFHEYGRATAEMALLLTFVLFGGSLIWSGFAVLGVPALLFTLLALVIRPAVMLAALHAVGLDGRQRALITWFGPRGLSSLLLVLLPVFSGLPGGERLFALCSLVVLVSIALHGGTLALIPRVGRQPGAGPTTAGEPAPMAAEAGPDAGAPLVPPRDGVVRGPAEVDGRRAIAGVPSRIADTGAADGAADGVAGGPDTPAPLEDPVRISIDELRELWRRGEPVVLLDVRTDRTYDRSATQARGAVRLSPERPALEAAARGLPRDAWLVAYCT